MLFNFGGFWRIIRKQILESENSPYRLSGKRIRFLVFFLFLFYLPLEIASWLGFLLDDLFFRGYRKQRIDQPVFIIGNPRSGTTFIHRLMAKDNQRFTTMQTWEIVFAPSITQRKVLQAFSALDRFLGSPAKQLLDRWEHRLVGQIETHKMGLREPEEDEYLFMHVCSSAVAWTFFPVEEEVLPYLYYDRSVPVERRNKDMVFYRECLKRHLFAHGGNKQFLSKNPLFSAKAQSLREFFPDAKLIYMTRNPIQVVPSLVSYMAAGFHLFCEHEEQYPYREEILKTIDFYYHYPLDLLSHLPQKESAVVRYDDLVENPAGAILQVYDSLGYQPGEAYQKVLLTESKIARKYSSKHTYSLQAMDLDHQYIFTRYKDIFQRFQFDPLIADTGQYDVFDLYYSRRTLQTRKKMIPRPGWRRIRIGKPWKNNKIGKTFNPLLQINLRAYIDKDRI